MSKKIAGVESYKVKELFFVALVIVIVFVGYLAFTSQKAMIPALLGLAVVALLAFILSQYNFLLTLKEFERAVIFRFGHVNRVGGPGWTMVMPVIESYKIVDLRTQTIDTPPQDVITKDRIVVKIDAIIYLYVKKDKESVIKSVVEIDDYKRGAEEFVIASIRDAAGELTLPELITNIEDLNKDVKNKLMQIASAWGVYIEAVAIQHLTLPKEVSDALHQEKVAEQQKLARMEKAKAHQAEIEAVRIAAEQLSDKAIAYYYIRALERLGEGRSTKFIFPMEISKIAEAISSRISPTEKQPELEQLFQKYAPAIKAFVEKNAKPRPIRRKRR